MTVRRYVDILAGTFMVRVLQPWHANVGKRLVKRPKVYLRDSGLFHALQDVATMAQLRTHNKLGASWEGFALECVCQSIDREETELYFWRTHAGAQVDLLWQQEGRLHAVEAGDLPWAEIDNLKDYDRAIGLIPRLTGPSSDGTTLLP